MRRNITYIALIALIMFGLVGWGWVSAHPTAAKAFTATPAPAGIADIAAAAEPVIPAATTLAPTPATKPQIATTTPKSSTVATPKNNPVPATTAAKTPVTNAPAATTTPSKNIQALAQSTQTEASKFFSQIINHDAKHHKDKAPEGQQGD